VSTAPPNPVAAPSGGTAISHLAPLPEPDSHPRLRKTAVVALIAILALAAAVGIRWLSVRPDERPSCCTETAIVTDLATGLNYSLPEGWNEFREGEFVQDFSSGARTDTEQPGGQVWTFTIEDWGGDPGETAEEAAKATTGFFYAAVPEEWEFLSSEPRTIGGVETYEVTWTAFHPVYEGPLYGRLLQIPTAEGDTAKFLFGFSYPDDEAVRDEIDWIFSTALMP
jgi:hypothetical protein